MFHLSYLLFLSIFLLCVIFLFIYLIFIFTPPLSILVPSSYFIFNFFFIYFSFLCKYIIYICCLCSFPFQLLSLSNFFFHFVLHNTLYAYKFCLFWLLSHLSFLSLLNTASFYVTYFLIFIYVYMLLQRPSNLLYLLFY